MVAILMKSESLPITVTTDTEPDTPVRDSAIALRTFSKHQG